MRHLLALIFLLVALAPAMAQDADLEQRRDTARQLVELTTASAVMGPLVEAMWPTLQMQITRGSPTADPKVMDELKAVFTDELVSTMSAVINDFADAYAKNFTLEELTTILDFYRSDAGAKMIAVQPKLMAEMLPSVTTKLQQSLPSAMENVIKEAEKRGFKARG